jgi:tellurite resistance protein
MHGRFNYKISFAPTVINFGLPMGLLGLGVNASHINTLFDTYYLAPFLMTIGLFSFVFLGLHYIYYLLLPASRAELLFEWRHPFTRSFLPAITLTAMLGITGLDSLYPLSDHFLWLILSGLAFFHLAISLYLIGGWIFNEKVMITDHKPTWFIVISGNFVASITFMTYFRTEQNAYEIAMFFYASGLFLWIAFATSILYRLIFHQPVRKALRPSLFIFLAPPSLACVASIHISEGFIHDGQILSSTISIVSWLSYSFASVMFMLWLTQSRYFISSGLSMASWSYVYPLAAYGLATQYMAQALNSPELKILSLVLLLFVLGLILLLFKWLYKRFIDPVSG